jgi:aryl-alcohol dehydrogenase-like predicted oxidoreductase
MEYRRLGRSDIQVSAICLGSMTWGEQNTEAEGFEQMDYAFDQGVNFIDTAEMYPIATRAETYGRTEEIIGNWMAARGNRDKVILATKIVGPNPQRFAYIRSGETRFNRATYFSPAPSGVSSLSLEDSGANVEVRAPSGLVGAYGLIELRR